MKRIYQVKFGSHLYGTNTPASDLDIKSVYLPCARDILLQRIQPVISQSRPKDHGKKNTAADIDDEAYSPEKFLNLMAEGQIVALDMLFAPEEAMLIPPDPIWREIQNLSLKVLNKRSASFVRYCRQQAHKYGIKGSRIAAARCALELLTQAEEQYGSVAKLASIAPDIIKITQNQEFLTSGEIMQADGSMVSYFEICGKKALFNASIKSARGIAQGLLNEYGQRALAAEKNEGVDWKALSHAVRVGHEALEFLSTQKVTFPRPEAKHLLDIKQGRLSFQDVADEIEDLLAKVDDAVIASTLPETHNPQDIDDFIEKLYRKVVIEESRYD